MTADPRTGGAHAQSSAEAVRPSDETGAPPANEAVACMACGHTAAEHDATARRYCDATVARALTRGCICRVL
jgi:hypothetical protein